MLLIKKINCHIEKIVALILGVITSGVIAIMLRYGMFTVPLADDYSVVAGTHNVWMDTHSVIKVVVKAIKSANKDYMEWCGSWPCMFMQKILPGLGDYKSYFWGSWILIVLFSFSVFVMFYCIMKKCFNLNLWQCIIMSCITFLIIIEGNPGMYDMFYWWNASVGYIGIYSLRLIGIGLTLSQWNVEPKNKKICRYWMLIWLEICFSACGDLVSGMVFLFIMLCITIYALYKQRNKLFYIVSMLSYVLGFFVALFAPGNFSRSNIVGSTKGVFETVKISYLFGYESINDWLTPAIVIISIILIPLILQIAKKIEGQLKFPIIITLYMYSVYSSQFASLVYSGYYEEFTDISSYTLPVVYCSFVLIWLFVWGYWVIWMSQYFTSKKQFPQKRFAMLLLLVLFYGGIKNDKINNLNTVIQYNLLKNNVCGEYMRDMLEREAILRESQNSDVEVPYIDMHKMLRQKDRTSEITDDPYYWQNGAVAMYYNKNSVRVYDYPR